MLSSDVVYITATLARPLPLYAQLSTVATQTFATSGLAIDTLSYGNFPSSTTAPSQRWMRGAGNQKLYRSQVQIALQGHTTPNRQHYNTVVRSGRSEC